MVGNDVFSASLRSNVLYITAASGPMHDMKTATCTSGFFFAMFTAVAYHSHCCNHNFQATATFSVVLDVTKYLGGFMLPTGSSFASSGSVIAVVSAPYNNKSQWYAIINIYYQLEVTLRHNTRERRHDRHRQSSGKSMTGNMRSDK